MQEVKFNHRGDTLVARYLRVRGGNFDYEVGDQSGSARIVALDDGHLDLEIDGVARQFAVTTRGRKHWVQTSAGEVALTELPRFPEPELELVTGGYVAPMPGRIVEVKVEAGQMVEAGDILIILEAMKMEHRISCAEGGTVGEVRVAAGEQVEAGDVLLVIDTGEGEE
jgi:propionyl-CoA carboxylase alpha chain